MIVKNINVTEDIFSLVMKAKRIAELISDEFDDRGIPFKIMVHQKKKHDEVELILVLYYLAHGEKKIAYKADLEDFKSLIRFVYNWASNNPVIIQKLDDGMANIKRIRRNQARYQTEHEE